MIVYRIYCNNADAKVEVGAVESDSYTREQAEKHIHEAWKRWQAVRQNRSGTFVNFLCDHYEFDDYDAVDEIEVFVGN